MRERRNSMVAFFWSILTPVRRLYWWVARPRTAGVKIIVQRDGRFLFVKNTYTNHGWTFPGGAVDRNEAPQKAAVRELAEEVGLSNIRLTFLGTYYSERQHKRDTVYCYTGEVDAATVTPVPQEIASVAWLPRPLDWHGYSRGARAAFLVFENYQRFQRASEQADS